MLRVAQKNRAGEARPSIQYAVYPSSFCGNRSTGHMTQLVSTLWSQRLLRPHATSSMRRTQSATTPSAQRSVLAKSDVRAGMPCGVRRQPVRKVNAKCIMTMLLTSYCTKLEGGTRKASAALVVCEAASRGGRRSAKHLDARRLGRDERSALLGELLPALLVALGLFIGQLLRALGLQPSLTHRRQERMRRCRGTAGDRVVA